MINIILVDDHQVVLDGLQLLLKDVEDVRVVGTAGDGLQLLNKLKTNINVDVILMDASMPNMNGFETTKMVKRLYPSIKILMLTMLAQQKYLDRAIEVGANGFLTKNKGKADFIEAIRQVSKGHEFVRMADLDEENNLTNNSSRQLNPDFPQLTERELQIICLITKRHTSREISKKLSISRLTLEVSKRTLHFKLGVRNDEGIIQLAIKYKLCTPN